MALVISNVASLQGFVQQLLWDSGPLDAYLHEKPDAVAVYFDLERSSAGTGLGEKGNLQVDHTARAVSMAVSTLERLIKYAAAF